MKRLTFITLALLAILGRVSAQESVSVNDITVPQGGEGFLEINYSFEGAGPYVGFMFLWTCRRDSPLRKTAKTRGIPGTMKV